MFLTYSTYSVSRTPEYVRKTITITAENKVTDDYEVHYAKCAGGFSLCCRVRVAGWLAYSVGPLSSWTRVWAFGEMQLVVSTQVGACTPDYWQKQKR